MSTPLETLTAHPYWVLGPLLLLFLASGWAQQRIIRTDLRKRVANPIRELERADTKAAMDRLTAALGAAGRRAARVTLRWDLLFLAAYGVALSLLCSVGSANLRRGGAGAAAVAWDIAAWLALLGAAFDLVENVLMWRMLSGPFEGDGLPRAKTVAARLKWTVTLGVTAVFALPALLFDLFGCRFGC